MPVSAHYLCGCGPVEPFRAEYGGGGQAGKSCARRQPGRARFGGGRQLRVL